VVDQCWNLGDARGKGVAIFGQVTTQCLDALRALMNRHIAGPEHNAARLLLFALHRNEAYVKPLWRFADGSGVRPVIILPLHARFHAGGWDQPCKFLGAQRFAFAAMEALPEVKVMLVVDFKCDAGGMGEGAKSH
jgi:hypothetical protein